MIESDDGIVPIEVKADRNLQAKSLKYYCRKFHPQKAVRISMGRYFRQTVADVEDNSNDYTLIDLPLFAMNRLMAECERQ